MSFLGAKGCLGGNVSLGNDGGAGNPNEIGVAGGADLGGKLSQSGSGGVENESGGAPNSNRAGASNATAGATTENNGGSASVGPTQRLSVAVTGQVASADAYGVSGSLYIASDGMGNDGASSGGVCELAGHTAAQCALVASPRYSAPNIPDWSGGLLCTSGVAERVLDVTGSPGSPDYGSMWGAALGFSFLERDGETQVYDASAHQVVGIAFDVDRVPRAGLRVEFITAIAPDEPGVWQPLVNGTPSAVAAVHAGHNVALFEDVKPLSFYRSPFPFDPTQLRSVQLHVPTATAASSTYSFCLSNLSLVIGTPAPRQDGCTGSQRASSAFAYDAAAACVVTAASVVGCDSPSDPRPAIPSAPAVSNLPCARRLSDDQLFLALPAHANPLDWQVLPVSSWSRLSADAFAECTAQEAALLAAATSCPVLPL